MHNIRGIYRLLNKSSVWYGVTNSSRGVEFTDFRCVLCICTEFRETTLLTDHGLFRGEGVQGRSAQWGAQGAIPIEKKGIPTLENKSNYCPVRFSIFPHQKIFYPLAKLSRALVWLCAGKKLIHAGNYLP